MASTGDQAGSRGSKEQVGETELMEKLNTMRTLLSQAKSESDPDRASQLMGELTEQSKLALELTLTHNLPPAKLFPMKQLFVEAIALNVQRSMEIQKKIIELTKPASKEDK